MKESIHKGHRARLRHRVEKESLANFEEHQVLEYILTYVIPQKDTNPLAHTLINTFGSIDKVLEAKVEDLEKVDGVGHITAMFLNSYLGVLYHYEKAKQKDDIVLDTPKKASDYCKSLLKNSKQEEIYLSCLDAQYKVLHTAIIKTGDETKINVSPRQILDSVLRNNASNIIMCHNHPKGTPNPSSEDIKFTRDLSLILMLNDTKLLDHIIISPNGYFSFRASGKLQEFLSQIESMLDSRKLDEVYISDSNSSYNDKCKEIKYDKK